MGKRVMSKAEELEFIRIHKQCAVCETDNIPIEERYVDYCLNELTINVTGALPIKTNYYMVCESCRQKGLFL